jgi:hypothetical protein
MQTAMKASRGTMASTVFMGGRDNGPAMTNYVYREKIKAPF